MRAQEVETQAKMNVLTAKYGETALGMEDDSLTRDLKDEEPMIAEKAQERDAAMERWAQVQQQQVANKPVWDLPFIAAQKQVSALIVAYSGAQDGPAKAMVLTLLNEASASAAETVRTDAVAAQNGYEQAVAARSALARRIEDLAAARQDYNTLDTALKAEKGEYEGVAAMAAEEQEKFNLSELNYRVVQLAVPAGEPEGMGFTRWVEIGLALGLAGGAVAAWVAAAMLQERRERRLSVTW